MKLLLISDYYSTWDIGGASRVLASQIEGLKINDEITQIELLSGYPGDDSKEVIDFKWYRSRYKSVMYLPALFFKMLWIRLVNCPDIVHIHQPLIGFFARLAFIGVPSVYHFHSFWYDEKVSHSDGSRSNKLLCRLKGYIEKSVLNSMKKFIVLSEFSKNKLQNVVKNTSIDIIPGCLDLNNWPLLPMSNNDGVFSFISVRRLDPRMGLDILLEGFAEFTKQIPCRLTIVGTGREEKKLHLLSSQLGLEKSVAFKGRLTDAELKEELSRHHCMVIPTKSIEGFGMTVIEAFATGLPILATKSGALVEFCKYAEVFYAVEEAEPKMIEDGLKWAVQNFSDRAVLRKKCRNVASFFDMHEISRQYMGIYKELKC